MSRGPTPPDREPDRPTVPEAADALRAYYALPGRSVGGAVHIITEDGNVEQSHADWCAANARRLSEAWGEGPEHADADERIAVMLAAMTPTQRWKLHRMSFYPKVTV